MSKIRLATLFAAVSIALAGCSLVVAEGTTAASSDPLAGDCIYVTPPSTVPWQGGTVCTPWD